MLESANPLSLPLPSPYMPESTLYEGVFSLVSFVLYRVLWEMQALNKHLFAEWTCELQLYL